MQHIVLSQLTKSSALKLSIDTDRAIANVSWNATCCILTDPEARPDAEDPRPWLHGAVREQRIDAEIFCWRHQTHLAELDWRAYRRAKEHSSSRFKIYADLNISGWQGTALWSCQLRRNSSIDWLCNESRCFLFTESRWYQKSKSLCNSSMLPMLLCSADW